MFVLLINSTTYKPFFMQINSCDLNRAQATSNSITFSNWLANCLDVLSGVNAGLFLVILRKVLDRDRDEASRELNKKILEIQQKARLEIKNAVLEYAPELKGNKWV